MIHFLLGRAGEKTPRTPGSGGGLTYAQGPRATYDRRTEIQTNTEQNVSLLRRSCLQLGYRPREASWRPYVLLPFFLFIAQMWRCYGLSVVCTSVRPTQPIERFSNISAPFCTLAIRRPPRKILRRSSQGTPLSGVKYKRGSQI